MSLVPPADWVFRLQRLAPPILQHALQTPTAGEAGLQTFCIENAADLAFQRYFRCCVGARQANVLTAKSVGSSLTKFGPPALEFPNNQPKPRVAKFFCQDLGRPFAAAR